MRGTELRLDRNVAALAARLEHDTADDRRVHLLDKEDLLAEIALQALANLGAQVVVERHRRRHRDAYDVVVFLGHGVIGFGHLRQQVELPALHERAQHGQYLRARRAKHLEIAQVLEDASLGLARFEQRPSICLEDLHLPAASWHSGYPLP